MLVSLVAVCGTFNHKWAFSNFHLQSSPWLIMIGMYIGGSDYIFDYDSDKDGKIGSDKLSFSLLFGCGSNNCSGFPCFDYQTVYE